MAARWLAIWASMRAMAESLQARGFEVTVVEDGRLGGLARTQWCYGDFLATLGGSGMAALEPIDGPAPTLRGAFQPSIGFERGDFALTPPAEAKLDQIAEAIKAYVNAVRDEHRPQLIWHHVAVKGDASEAELACTAACEVASACGAVCNADTTPTHALLAPG